MSKAIDLLPRSLKYPAIHSVVAAEVGILPNGTDYSTKMQALVDGLASRGGGRIILEPSSDASPYVLQWHPRSGVTVECRVKNRLVAGIGSIVTAAVVQAPAAGGDIVAQEAGTTIQGGGVKGIRFRGRGAGTAARGVVIGVTDVARGFAIENCNFDNFADEGMIFGEYASLYRTEAVYATNCLLNRTRTAASYVADFSGLDGAIIQDVQAGPSLTALTDANKYVRSIRLGKPGGTANGMRGDNIVAEFGDISLEVGVTAGNFGRLRAEFAMAENALITGPNTCIQDLKTTDGSKAGDGVYDSVYVTALNVAIRTVRHLGSNGTVNVRYVVNDTLSASDANKNDYGLVTATGRFSGLRAPTTSKGSRFDTQSGPFVLLTANSTTPTAEVGGRTHVRLQTANTGATSLTSIGGLPDGARVVIFCNDANTTLTHNGTGFVLPGSVSLKLIQNCSYTFTVRGAALWFDWQVPAALTATAAQIASATALVNTVTKFQGRIAYDTTNHRLMVADGSTATSNWWIADGSASVTPA